MKMENDNSRQEIWSPYLWHCVGNEKRLIQFHISGIHISGVVMAIKNADSRPDIWSQYFWSHEGNEHCRVKARYTVIYVYIRTSTLTSTSTAQHRHRNINTENDIDVNIDYRYRWGMDDESWTIWFSRSIIRALLAEKYYWHAFSLLRCHLQKIQHCHSKLTTIV